jgi:hypothetical protein
MVDTTTQEQFQAYLDVVLGIKLHLRKHKLCLSIIGGMGRTYVSWMKM